MDLKQLRYFVTVAKELHFERVAQRLFISQPALNFDIRKFESQLGVQLLARTNKSVALTNAGQVLLDEARKLLQQAAEMERITQRSAHGLTGRLRVGFVNSMLYHDLPRAAQRFEADHPVTEIILREMSTDEQVQAIRCQQVDLGCAYWGTFSAEVVSAPIFSEPFLVCLPAGHALACRKSLALDAPAQAPLVPFPRTVSPHYHDLIIALCVDADPSPEIRHEARLWQTVVTMVGFGMGVALVPRTLQHADDVRVSFVPLADDEKESPMLSLRRTDDAEPVTNRFLEHLGAAVQENVEP